MYKKGNINDPNCIAGKFSYNKICPFILDLNSKSNPKPKWSVPAV